MAETVGSLIDKISIIELKIVHMEDETRRPDASVAHRASCGERLGILRRQRQDLREELTTLFADLCRGRQTLKVYRQFKMYNDPSYQTPSRHGPARRP